MNYNEEIIRLWNKESNYASLNELYNGKVLAPILYPKLSKNCLLTIGINPSFSAKSIKNQIQNNEIVYFEHLKNKEHLTEQDIENHFLFTNFTHKASWITYEKHAREKYRYYSKHKKIKKKLGLPWSHIDMFYVRDTDQMSFLKNMDKYPAFRDDQIRLTKKIILDLNPELLLVANASSVDFFDKEFCVKNKYWNDHCCLFTEIGDRHIQTYFSGQLSSMANVDYDRLMWVIERNKGLEYEKT